MGRYRVKYDEIVDENDKPVVWIEDDGACRDPECCGSPMYNLQVDPDFKAWLESIE